MDDDDGGGGGDDGGGRQRKDGGGATTVILAADRAPTADGVAPPCVGGVVLWRALDMLRSRTLNLVQEERNHDNHSKKTALSALLACRYA